LTGRSQRSGEVELAEPLPVVDGLLAATAKVVGLTLVTRAHKHWLAKTGSIIDLEVS